MGLVGSGESPLTEWLPTLLGRVGSGRDPLVGSGQVSQVGVGPVNVGLHRWDNSPRLPSWVITRLDHDQRYQEGKMDLDVWFRP